MFEDPEVIVSTHRGLTDLEHKLNMFSIPENLCGR